MPTFREAEAAKVERLRREARHFTPDLRGVPCPICRRETSAKLQEATRDLRHPCCAEPAIMALGDR